MKDNTTDRTIHVGQAIKSLLDTYRLQSKFNEVSLTSSWEELVGKSIAKRTKKVFIRDKILFVEMKSAALKHDLNLLKSQILDVIHTRFGKQAIHKIVLLLWLLVGYI